MIISWRPELIGPLGNDLGVEDLHDLHEIFIVDAHNRRIQEARYKR